MRASVAETISALGIKQVGWAKNVRTVNICGRVPRDGVSPQPGQAEIHGAQRATADSRVGKVSLQVCKPSSCM